MTDLPLNWRTFLRVKKAEYAVHCPELQLLPKEELTFKTFELTAPQDVRVVILGQSPYPDVKKATGLAFSVPEEFVMPKTLSNIFKELSREYGYPMPQSGNLEPWAQQGVLLLNRVLTTEQGISNAHKLLFGWEDLTNLVLRRLSMRIDSIVFMLWGKDAQSCEPYIHNRQRHLILKAPHPSPLSANTGFFGCQHFEIANMFLNRNKRGIIQWRIK